LLEWILGGDPGMPLPIPPPNRELVSQFIGLQRSSRSPSE
jgi:hypothetical protein